MTPRLSKSRVQSGRQCHKRLWLELNQPDDAEWGGAAQARLDEGTRFGELARELLGGGHLIDADHMHVREALAQTQLALDTPRTKVPMLFEPAFSFRNVRVRVDILRRGNTGDTLIEVKSTASVKEENIWDCAIQTWVARGAGRPIRKVVLAHVNNQFVYTTPGDYTGLLVQQDITKDVEALQSEVPRLVAGLKKVAAGPMPTIKTGEHCSTPYDCPFLTHCQAQEPALPEFPISILPWASAALIKRLTDAGYRDIREVPETELPSERHKLIAAVTRSNVPHVHPEFKRTLAAIPYPRFFLDFETIGFAIPRWLGTRPYQQIPFQFSCHSESAPGKIGHDAFLDLSGEPPLQAFVDRLIDTVSGDGPIIVWNRGFEASRLADLGSIFPRKRKALRQITERMVDLLPLYRDNYYHRDMLGSWSIKNVLPTVAPELGYDDLDIGGGNEAQAAYLEAIDPNSHASRREEIGRQLLEYCKRDTYAMIRLMKPGSAKV